VPFNPETMANKKVIHLNLEQVKQPGSKGLQDVESNSESSEQHGRLVVQDETVVRSMSEEMKRNIPNRNRVAPERNQ